MKKILLLALPLMAMCFASCEKDNGNEDNSVQKRVANIIYPASQNYPFLGTESFGYDEKGRVTRYIYRSLYTSTGYETTFQVDVTYEGNRIIETTSGGAQMGSPIARQLKEEYIHHLNAGGYVIKTEYKDYWSDESYNQNGVFTYEYQNGKLVKIVEKYSEPYAHEHEYTLEWQDKNITTVSNESGDADNFLCSSIVDNLNINLFSFNAFTFDLTLSPANLKFKGTTSRHFPKMVDGNLWSYELDSDGCIKAILRDGEPYCTIEYVE